jgi:hypothetical protein
MISIHFIVHYLSLRRISAAYIYRSRTLWKPVGFTLSDAVPNGAMDLPKTAIGIAGFVPVFFMI